MDYEVHTSGKGVRKQSILQPLDGCRNGEVRIYDKNGNLKKVIEQKDFKNIQKDFIKTPRGEYGRTID